MGAAPPRLPGQTLLDRPPRAGDRLGPYQLGLELARGGMATLFLAHTDGRAGLHRFVALKCIRPELAEDERFITMFLDEARIATQLHHANICSVIDFDCRRGVHYIAMEFLHGQNLGALRRQLETLAGTRKEPDPARRAGLIARIMADAAEGLHAAHELRGGNGVPLDVVHRDVSPENIFVTYDGTVKVLDFGVASSVCQQHHTRTGVIKGKYGYLQPEVLHGHRADRRADVWCMGVVTWELLTGQRLFERPTEVETVKAIERAAIPRPGSLRLGLPEALDDIVMRALDRDPAARFPTAREFGRHLTRFLVEHRLAIGLPEVAELMADAFPSGREGLRRMLDQVQQQEATTPAVIVDEIPIEEAEPEAEAANRQEARTARDAKRPLYLGALGILGLLAGFWLLVLTTRGDDAKAAPVAPAPAAVAVPPAPIVDPARPMPPPPPTVNIVLFQFAAPAPAPAN